MEDRRREGVKSKKKKKGKKEEIVGEMEKAGEKDVFGNGGEKKRW